MFFFNKRLSFVITIYGTLNLRKRADGSHDVRGGEHDLGQDGVGHVGHWTHDGVQAVDGDNDHDEA